MNVSSPFCSRSAAMKKSASEGPHASVFPSLSAWITLVQSFPATTERDRHEKSVHNHHHHCAQIPHPSTPRPPPSSVSSLPINSFLPPLITAGGYIYRRHGSRSTAHQRNPSPPPGSSNPWTRSESRLPSQSYRTVHMCPRRAAAHTSAGRASMGLCSINQHTYICLYIEEKIVTVMLMCK
jgi:hypothetical protein